MIRLFMRRMAVACMLLTATPTIINTYAQSTASKAAESVVKGVVVSADDGEPLVGVFVFVKGTKYGVSTDVDGNFSLRAPAPGKSYTLVFQYIGMAEKEIVVKEAKDLRKVALENDNELESAVITTGYGRVQNRADMVGNAFQVNSESIRQLPATRIDNMLDGMVPGVRFETNNTTGRSTVKVRVRGDASLSASSEPLWVVDGVPMYTGEGKSNIVGTSYSVSPFSMINPDDIESITVLKDAATSVLYGADGANGVILVTTKKATQGKPRFSLSIKQGVSKLDRTTTLKYCSTEQWWELAKESWVNSGRPIEAFPYQDNEHNSYSTTSTDWIDVYAGIGSTTDIRFSASGGTENLQNRLSFAYYSENPVIKGSNQTRVSLSDRTKYTLFKGLTLDSNVNLRYNVNDIFSVSSISSVSKVIPIFSPYDEDGVTPRLYNWYSTNDKEYEPVQKNFVYNYVPNREFNTNIQRTVGVIANERLVWNPFYGFTVESSLGLTGDSTFEQTYTSSRSEYSKRDDGLVGSSLRSGVMTLTWDNINRVMYSRNFDKHYVTALAIAEFSQSANRYVRASISGFTNDYIQEISYGDKNSLYAYSGSYIKRKESFKGQLEYIYDHRYSIQGTISMNGVSSFGEFAKWDNNWAVGATYNMQKEPWFNSSTITTLRLKASFGKTANSNIDTSSSLGTYTFSESMGYNGETGAHQSTPPNPGLSWEKCLTPDASVVIGFFNRFELSLDAYYKYTYDLIYSGRVSSVIYGSSISRNVGAISNRGIELSLNAKVIDGKDLKWTMFLHGSHNYNIIEKLYKGTHTGYFDYVWMEGATKDAWWLVRWAGVDPSNGAPMWYDIDGNLTYAFTYDNRVLLPQYPKYPLVYGGMTQNFKYKDFTLNMNFSYDIGGYHLFEYRTDGSDVIGNNVVVEELDHWRQPGDISPNPAYIYKNPVYSGYSSTRDLMSMTNIIFKNISLQYQLPEDFCKKLGFKGIIVDLTVDNPYLWSPYQSKDRNSYKTIKYSGGMTRTYSASVMLNF